MKADILGIKIDNLTFDKVVEKIDGFVRDNKKHYVVTPNPEFLVVAQKDTEFKKILNEADLAVPDGVGLLWASRLLGGQIKERVTGTDLVDALCKIATKKGYTVGFLGAGPGVAEKAAVVLRERHQGLKVVLVQEECSKGAVLGFRHPRQPTSFQSALRVPVWRSPDLQAGLRVANTSPRPIQKSGGLLAPEDFIDIFFVAFGQVKQEKWIARNLNKIPVKVAIGVGGAFDFIAGIKKRAPLWIRKMGLEWLFRLILEPWRIKRQLALPYFVWLVLREKLTKEFTI